jgi:hypothetical protein
MSNSWRWAMARSIGTSHASSELDCQDFALCIELDSVAGKTLVAVVSDGAGTASHATSGAKMVCTTFLRVVADRLRSGWAIGSSCEEEVLAWLDAVRDRIYTFSQTRGLQPRDCAATLVGMVICPQSSLLVHVGDGAAALRLKGTSNWIVPSWPYHGEYASTTAFVTDDPMPAPQAIVLPNRIDRMAIFSDGLERLVLDYAKKEAYQPFFEAVMQPIIASRAKGWDHQLSKALESYLGSKQVCDRTDDDKSLILGVRV